MPFSTLSRYLKGRGFKPKEQMHVVVPATGVLWESAKTFYRSAHVAVQLISPFPVKTGHSVFSGKDHMVMQAEVGGHDAAVTPLGSGKVEGAWGMN